MIAQWVVHKPARSGNLNVSLISAILSGIPHWPGPSIYLLKLNYELYDQLHVTLFMSISVFLPTLDLTLEHYNSIVI